MKGRVRGNDLSPGLRKQVDGVAIHGSLREVWKESRLAWGGDASEFIRGISVTLFGIMWPYILEAQESGRNKSWV